MSEILVFDSETLGIPDWKSPSGGEDQPHIVQLAALLCDEETREVKQSMDVIVRPDGWEIPQDMTDIHGITNEYALEVGIPEKMAVAMFLELWRSCRLRVAHSTTFDNRIIRIATKRYFSEEVQVNWKEGDYFCTMINSRKIMGGKQPTLEEAYQYFTGKTLENAHTAIADTNACMEIYWELSEHPEHAFK